MSKIKEHRIAAGLTQQAMSDIMKIPKRTIEDWESERRSPPEWAEILIINELKRITENKPSE